MHVSVLAQPSVEHPLLWFQHARDFFAGDTLTLNFFFLDDFCPLRLVGKVVVKFPRTDMQRLLVDAQYRSLRLVGYVVYRAVS